MNDLIVSNSGGVERMLGTASLEEIRLRTLYNIESNPALTEQQKRTVIKELDFLIEHERLRRLRQFAFQWIEEDEKFRHKRIVNNVELANSICISRKKTALKIAQLNREIINCRLDLIERIKQLRPKDDSITQFRKAISDLNRLRLQKIIMRAQENMFHQNLTDRTLNRKKFIDKVKSLYPDMADELIDYYDRQVFQQTKRR